MSKNELEALLSVLEGTKYTNRMHTSSDNMAQYVCFNLGIDHAKGILEAYANGDLDTIIQRED